MPPRQRGPWRVRRSKRSAKAEGIRGRGWRDGCGARGGAAASVTDIVPELVEGLWEGGEWPGGQRGPGRKRPTPGSGAAAGAGGAAPCKGAERRGLGSYNEDDLMRPRRPPAGACDEDGLAARWEEPATTERIRSFRDSSGGRKLGA